MLELVRALARERIKPRAAEIDAVTRVPVGYRRALSRARALRAPLRRSGRRHGHGHTARAEDDRGDLEGLRHLRPDPGGAGARVAGAQARRLARSRGSGSCRRLASGAVARRLCADRGGIRLGLGGDAHDRAARRRRLRARRRQSGSSRTPVSRASTRCSRRPTLDAGHAGITAFVVEAEHAGVRGDAARAEDRHRGLDDRRAGVRRGAGAGWEPARGERAKVSSSRCASSTARGRG